MYARRRTCISIVIIITGLKIIKEAYDVLIDKCIDADKVDEIRNTEESIRADCGPS